MVVMTALRRVADEIGGGPRAVANAAQAVRHDVVAARQRREAWEALTPRETPHVPVRRAR